MSSNSQEKYERENLMPLNYSPNDVVLFHARSTRFRIGACLLFFGESWFFEDKATFTPAHE